MVNAVGNGHNRRAPDYVTEVDAFKVKLHDRDRSDASTHIPQIYQDEIVKLRRNPDVAPDALLRLIPKYDAMRTSMYRQRHKTVPRLPQTLQDIDLQDQWTRTEAGERFLHRLEGQSPIFIFTTDQNLELLSDADVLFADGTFSTCPRLFDQIYSIHAEFQGHMLPLVYGLMSDRTEDSYTRMFTYLKQTSANLGHQLVPTTFQMDFERASHNAVAVVFPGTQRRGCFFHYTQCIWRRVQKIGLATEYKHDEDVTKLVRRAAALPLVPEDKVEDVWVDAIGNAPQGEKATQLMDLVTSTWIEGSWPLSMWNHFGNDGHRTNNNLEGWHHKINKFAKKTHPNIYELVRLIQKEQSVAEVKI
ncbi:uncharacterized protein LOC124257380 [Haliotis rubra]|uniref:uncharacterized protein LOC124257380 n=1 Tax=Haliotis rubra TaxID=36100 RepID=UPI001EE53206|nr:uncharacterized protein LOC124257380 [Haliotis rubra]